MEVVVVVVVMVADVARGGKHPPARVTRILLWSVNRAGPVNPASAVPPMCHPPHSHQATDAAGAGGDSGPACS